MRAKLAAVIHRQQQRLMSTRLGRSTPQHNLGTDRGWWNRPTPAVFASSGIHNRRHQMWSGWTTRTSVS